MTYSISPGTSVMHEVSPKSNIWNNASTRVRNSFKNPIAIVDAFCFFDRPVSPVSSIAVSNSILNSQ